MKELKKQTLNEYLAEIATKKIWLFTWFLLLLNAIIMGRFIYINGEGITKPIILMIISFVIMFVISTAYGLYLLYLKKDIDNPKKKKVLLILSNIVACSMVLLITVVIIERSFCATDGASLVFALFTYIILLPVIYRVKILPYAICLLASLGSIFLTMFLKKGQTFLVIDRAFFFVTIYVSSFIMELLIDRVFVSAFKMRDSAYEIAELQTKIAQELLKQNAKLKNETVTDYLTNLGNRKSLVNDVEIIFKEYSKKSVTIDVAIIDIDNFKKINDEYGHQKGDIVLKRVSQIINEIAITYNGHAYRYGGEEFLIIFAGIGKVKLNEYMNTLSKEISNVSFSEIDNRIVTVSIGTYSNYPTSKEDFDKFLSQADKRMYEQKNKKKRKV